MRHPLPDALFPPLALSSDDVDGLRQLAAVFVQDALSQFHEFRTKDHGVVDERRWKLVKKHRTTAAYSDRSIADAAENARSAAPRGNVGNMSYYSAKLHAVLAVGTLEGELGDLMLGLHHWTPELQRLKSAYMDDKIVDARILATVEAPSVEQPLHGLHIKWAVSEFAPYLLRQIVRPRDFVYLEAIGMHVTAEGERIGYNLLHSLEIPSIRQFSDHQIVRGNFSICGVFRQQRPGEIQLYMKGFVDSMGDIHTSVAIPGTADALLSYRKGVHCGQMKKLHWFLKANKRHASSVSDGQRRLCVSCHQPAKASAVSCQVCLLPVCTSCGLTRRMSFLHEPSKRIVRRSLTFCPQCIASAARADAVAVAVEQQQRQNPLEAFEFSSNGSAPADPTPSPSNSVLLDVQREFFG